MGLKFIDLFAGLGGFHKALNDLGCECVFASELLDDLRALYLKNFPEMKGKTKSGINKVEGDITKVPYDKIPQFDILCAGFPCQPFSQAGKRQGFNDDAGRGTLFDRICDIITAQKRRPKYLLLENVANLEGHDGGNTWKTIYRKLSDSVDNGGLNYEVKKAILSPHQFGIPQHRKRIYIVAIDRNTANLDDFSFPVPSNEKCSIDGIIDTDDVNIIKLKKETRQQIEIWQEFIDKTIENGDIIPSFPIWAMEFGATYDYSKTAPAFQPIEALRGKRGHLGKIITGDTVEECIHCLPKYAQAKTNKELPEWKKRYISQNRAFYAKHRKWLKAWLKKVMTWDNSHLKLEWNCGANFNPDLHNAIIQFRASGIRAKLPTYSPALNLVGTQTPIFPWVKIPKSVLKAGEHEFGRYMSVKECAKLQGMEDLIICDKGNEGSLTTTRAIEALGNAVNVTLVKKIASKLLKI